MIGRLAGRLALKARDHVMIDVGGVGYVVYVSDRTMAGLPPEGQAVALFTDLLVREDLLQLFGFLSAEEKEWHRLLMSVQGIGAKASMAILGTIGAEGVTRAIALGDWASVKAAPVAPKPEPGAQAEAMSALANLGYAPAEAARAVAEARGEDPEADTATLIRAALKKLAPGG
jgi:Holliday junction DNA helicase RuvA